MMAPVEQFVDRLHQAPAHDKTGRFRFEVRVSGPLTQKALTPPFTSEWTGVRGGPIARPGVRTLIPSGSTTQSGVAAIRETSFTNNAAVVLPTELKPESDWTGESVENPVATIAHTMRISRQVWEDAPALTSLLQNRMLNGLTVAEDEELLHGDGTNGHVDGLLKMAMPTTGVTAPVAPGLLLGAISTALQEITAAGYTPSGIVLNPANWLQIQQSVNAGGNGYTIGFPGVPSPPSLWNIPIVPTPAMPVGQFLVGDFLSGAQIFDREDANFIVATMDRDHFVKNLLTLRAEERLALAVYQPACFRKAGP